MTEETIDIRTEDGVEAVVEDAPNNLLRDRDGVQDDLEDDLEDDDA